VFTMKQGTKWIANLLRPDDFTNFPRTPNREDMQEVRKEVMWQCFRDPGSAINKVAKIVDKDGILRRTFASIDFDHHRRSPSDFTLCGCRGAHIYNTSLASRTIWLNSYCSTENDRWKAGEEWHYSIYSVAFTIKSSLSYLLLYY
jgi:hypothetical protein